MKLAALKTWNANESETLRWISGGNSNSFEYLSPPSSTARQDIHGMYASEPRDYHNIQI